MSVGEWVTALSVPISLAAIAVSVSTRLEMRHRFRIERGVYLRMVLRGDDERVDADGLPGRHLVVQNMAGGVAHSVSVVIGTADDWSMMVNVERLSAYGEEVLPLCDTSGRHSPRELLALLLADGDRAPRVSATWRTAEGQQGRQESVPVALF